jgi:tRNA threonylcarbamoyladenosine biosynthesis protein TsaE
MDMYRLSRPEEMLAIGVEDYFFGDGVCLVEWAEKLGELLPGDATMITIRHRDARTREIEIRTSLPERGTP